MQPADVAAENRASRPGRALAEAITALHEAIAAEPDPAHKEQITRALSLVLAIQKEIAQGPATAGAQRR